jgi:hypothetical protein
MKILRYLGYTLLTLVVAIGLFLFAARFADGPVELIAGGPFTSGEKYSGAEPDWSFVRDRATVEFQLENPARSRTTWIIEHQGKIYIPSGYMTTTWGKIWKKWPIEAEKDGSAILRVDGKLYPRYLRRLEDGPELAPVIKKLGEKYNVPANLDAVSSGYLWLFEIGPRAS